MHAIFKQPVRPVQLASAPKHGNPCSWALPSRNADKDQQSCPGCHSEAGHLHTALDQGIPRSPHPGQQVSQQQQQQQDHPQQQQYWYTAVGPQQLQAALQLPSWRFQSLIQQEPSILAYQPETLQATLQALAAALHLNHKAVVGIIEQRPALLLQPQEAVQVLTYLSHLLGRTTQQTAFLLSPHPQLLAMQPQQLQQHVHQVCEIMHWPPTDLQQAVAAGAVGPASLLQLLALPVQQTAGRMQDLSNALSCSLAVTAQLVQHHPALLNMGPAVLRSRLFAIAQADGSSCEGLLAELDQQQLRGLSGLLLLSPSRLTSQLQGLVTLLTAVQQPGPRPDEQSAMQNSSQHDDTTSRLAARLCLRLGTRVPLADVQVKMVLLQGIVRSVRPWQQQLAAASEKELAALLSVSHEGLAQAKYLAATCQSAVGMSLLDVVSKSPADFGRTWPGYVNWLSGMEQL